MFDIKIIEADFRTKLKSHSIERNLSLFYINYLHKRYASDVVEYEKHKTALVKPQDSENMVKTQDSENMVKHRIVEI